MRMFAFPPKCSFVVLKSPNKELKCHAIPYLFLLLVWMICFLLLPGCQGSSARKVQVLVGMANSRSSWVAGGSRRMGGNVVSRGWGRRDG